MWGFFSCTLFQNKLQNVYVELVLVFVEFKKL